ncbi:hypothetical protein RJ640_010900 [Escallonia rubra]|uniref:Transposase (putative) gypsy type domain-containing protein n=1 Tax=Escallonia rubra TaxID=112253 RepID=A0AA88QJ44_9ASTE|nr:hypothetical protein RJ640_010900 [Escallonia rubra]
MSSTSSSSSSSSTTSSTENTLESNSESRSSQVGTSTLRSQVGTSTPQASTSIPRGDALEDIKDEAEDKFDEDTWFTADEKRNKMTRESIMELLEEFPLPPPFSARVPALQEPANYGTDLETSVYEDQIKSGYRILMHPFTVAFFNYYKMTPGQLVPNGWRKLVGLIYLVQTSGYPVTVHDFMRLYLEVCYIKNKWLAKVKAQKETFKAYCYTSQMQYMFTMAIDMARNAETEKIAAVGKVDKLDKEVKDLKTENADLLTKLGRLEKRYEKFRHEKAEIGNNAIQAFLDGTAGEEWLQKRTEDGLSIFQEGFQKAKELMMEKYPSLFLDDVVVPTFELPSGKTVAPTEAGDAISSGEKSIRSGNAPIS